MYLRQEHFIKAMDMEDGFSNKMETLQNKQKRTAIANRLSLFAENMDKIVGILQENADKI